jgi:CheY-like chemotaxis protein
MRAPCNGLTALIVEDDWLLREEAGGFRDEGWVVLEAGTGGKALELVRVGPTIDILVTDIGLADDVMTGWDVAEAVRIAYPEIPVIYSSGGAGDDRRRVSASVFLSKPAALQDFTRACCRLLPAARERCLHATWNRADPTPELRRYPLIIVRPTTPRISAKKTGAKPRRQPSLHKTSSSQQNANLKATTTRRGKSKR